MNYSCEGRALLRLARATVMLLLLPAASALGADHVPVAVDEVTAVDPAADAADLLEEEAMEDAAPAEDEDPAVWSGSVNVASGTSMAVFHPTEYVRSYGRSMSLSVGGSARYRVSEVLSASAGVGAAYHLVNPKDLSGRRLWLSDPSLGLAHRSLYKDEAYTGINVSGSLSASVGLSPSSRYWNRYGSLSGSLGASRSFIDGRLSATWSLSLGVSFSRYTSPTVSKLSDDGLDMALARADGGELLAGRYNLVSGNAQLGSLGNTFSLRFRAMEGLSANVSFGVSQSYRYCPPIDHLSSDAVDHHGDPIVRQGDVCRSDGMTGSFGASYSFADDMSVSASFASAQPFFAYRGTSLTEESRVLRFPWWDPDLHMTSFSLRVSKSF